MKSLLQEIERYVESDSYKGWDPYDGLNSRFLKALTLNRKWPRVTAIQVMKRSPVNLRPLLGVVKARNPKVIGILASAYLVRYRKMKEHSYLNSVRNLLDWLITNSSPGYSGYAWGYNFDWQSAVFYIPKGVPTVVNTALIANAFLDAYGIFKEKNYLEVARSSCDFILNDLNCTYRYDTYNSQSAFRNSKCFCFSYSPVDKTCCYNANLLAAELLARVCCVTHEKPLLDCATSAVDFSLLHQNPDGSWYYGLSPWQRYIDSFHSGFVLVSLLNYAKYSQRIENHILKRAILKGFDYYKKSFFEENGLPKYYHNKKYPIDLHCSAQGIITFLRFREFDNKAVDIAHKIAEWAIDNMWDSKNGYFYFQKNRCYINKIPYLRWPNAWMYYALSLLNEVR